MKERKPSTKNDSLVGLYGHTFIIDEQDIDKKMIQYQFQIIRRVPPDRWLVQLFSFVDGRPTQAQVYPESFILSEDVKLYILHDEWCGAHEAECERRRWHGKQSWTLPVDTTNE
jgi:hypothetical protein